MISLLFRGAAVPLVLQRQLVGIGQIYFQDTPLFGAVLLLCLYLTAPAMAIGCVVGVCSASLTAWALNLPQESRNNGLYSFNGALTGIGLCALYRLDATLLIWAVALGGLTAALTHAMQLMRVAPLTFPFVLMMWLTAAIVPESSLLAPSASASAGGPALPAYLFSSLGQATFIAAAPLGVLLWATIARHDWRLATATLMAAGLAWLTVTAANTLWPDISIAAQSTGAGVNSVLAMLALSVRGCGWPKKIAGATLSIALAIIFGSLSLPYFTLPFILAVQTIAFLPWPSSRVSVLE